MRRFLQALDPRAPAATVILEFVPWKTAQVDFGAGPRLLDERSGELYKSGVFVMTLCHSRHQYAEIIWRQDMSSWLECRRHASACSAGIGRAIR